MLSEISKETIKYFYIGQEGDAEPDLCKDAVEKGVSINVLVDAFIDSWEESEEKTPAINKMIQNVKDNHREACSFVAGILGLT